MGGGGSQTVTQTNLPSYAKKYYTSLMDRSNKISKEKYQPYGGDRIANLTKLQRQGITDLRRETGDNPYTKQLEGNMKGASGTARGLTGFESGKINSRDTSTQGWGDDIASRYMSPYMQEVVNRQKEGARLDYDRGRSDRNARAVNAGSFGGSRQAVADYLEKEGLDRRLGDIEASGAQSAYEQAMSQFNNDMARFLQSDTGNAERSLQARIADEQARVAAAGVRKGGADSLASYADLYNKFGESAVGMNRQAIMDRLDAGKMLQEDKQREADLAYSDFENQRDYDRQTLAWLNSMLRGVPVSSNSTVSQYGNQNTLAQIAGLGLGGIGMYQKSQQQG